MKSALLRFWLCAGLFTAWIALLLYLALTTRNPVILSRPQIMASTLDVVAKITKPDSGTATVVEVLWPASEKGKWEGKVITVANLPLCARETKGDQADLPDTRTENERYTGPGEYILPLQDAGQGRFKVAAPQRSPGFDPSRYLPHIYLKSPAALHQFEEMRQ